MGEVVQLRPGPDRPPSRGGLTPLDRRVLDALKVGRGQRAQTVIDRVIPGNSRERKSEWASSRALARRDAEEILGILRGFEHLGEAVNRAGWWRRIDPMERERNAEGT